MNSVESHWPIGLALVMALTVGWLLRDVRSRPIHVCLAICSLAAAFAVHKLLHPRDSSSLWLHAFSSFLVFLGVVELSQGIWMIRNAMRPNKSLGRTRDR